MQTRKLKSDFGDIVFDVYEPSSQALGSGFVVQIAHAMLEHRARYKWLCENLASAGFKVYINDHRGHGDSVNCIASSVSRTPLALATKNTHSLTFSKLLSYFFHKTPNSSRDTWSLESNSESNEQIYLGEMGKDGFEKAVLDLKNLNELIKAENPSAKILLLGHSMGSLLSRRFLQDFGDSIDMLVLSGTPSPNVFAPFGAWLCRVLDSVCKCEKSRRLALKLIAKMSLGVFNKKFENEAPKSRAHWICTDNFVVQQYDADPKCSFLFTLQSFGNLFAGLSKVFSPYPKPLKNQKIPILMMSGEDDACGEFGAGVQKAYEHIIAQGFNNVTLKMYPNCRHEVFNEVQKEQYFADLLEWFEKHRI